MFLILKKYGTLLLTFYTFHQFNHSLFDLILPQALIIRQSCLVWNDFGVLFYSKLIQFLMKFFSFLIALPILLSLSAAQDTFPGHSRQASTLDGMSATEFAIRKDKKESQLQALKTSYFEAEDNKQASIRAQMLAVLYELFDLNQIKKNAEANQLKDMLKALENLDAIQDSEVNELKLKLNQVEAQISTRQKFRDSIVSQRLQELLSE